LEGIEETLEAAPDLWFGGVELEQFLEALCQEEREVFCVRLMETNRFRLNQSSGRVHPGRTDLRRCTEAMLIGEEDPLPLTWILELIRKTGFHPNLERYDLLRRRSKWRTRYDFPDEMILWRE